MLQKGQFYLLLVKTSPDPPRKTGKPSASGRLPDSSAMSGLLSKACLDLKIDAKALHLGSLASLQGAQLLWKKAQQKLHGLGGKQRIPLIL